MCLYVSPNGSQNGAIQTADISRVGACTCENKWWYTQYLVALKSTGSESGDVRRFHLIRGVRDVDLVR